MLTALNQSKTLKAIFLTGFALFFAGFALATDEKTSSFTLKSPEAVDGGLLPQEFTGDGASSTLPLEWAGAPEATKSFAVIMHHIPPDGSAKWYWILYNIPASVRSLPKNAKNTGITGNNSVNNKLEYAPPHSKGPGPKTYVYTVYALSDSLTLDVKPSEVNREALLAAMKGRILATAEMKVVYSRPEGAADRENGEKSGPPPREDKPR